MGGWVDMDGWACYPSIYLSIYTLPGATRKKRCRIAVARYLPLAMLPPPALRMSGRSASQLIPRYGLHCRRRPRALELQTRLEPHAWALGATGSAAWAEAGALASASHWALSGTAAPLECGAMHTHSQPCQPQEAGAASRGAPESGLSAMRRMPPGRMSCAPPPTARGDGRSRTHLGHGRQDYCY